MIRLVTGGMKSGKSDFAQSFYEGCDDVVYIATANPTDEEMSVRIRKLKEDRPKGWKTYERDENLYRLIGREDYYLLDCVTSLISNLMYFYTQDIEVISFEKEAEIENKIYEELLFLVNEARKQDKELIIVTNEVGSSLTPMNHMGRVFTDIQGRLNQKLAKMADEVYLVVSGLSIRIK